MKKTNRVNYEEQPLYIVNDFYFGVLGMVNYNKSTYYFTGAKKYIIITIRKSKKFSSYSNVLEAVDVFSNSSYFFFYGNRNPYEVLERCNGTYCVGKYSPIGMLEECKKEKISLKELRHIYNELNNIEEVEEQKITDSILNLILRTKEKANEFNLDDETRRELDDELMKLGEEYIDRMAKSIDSSSLDRESEYTIQMATIKKLVRIESIISNPESIKKRSLKKQLDIFRNKLN